MTSLARELSGGTISQVIITFVKFRELVSNHVKKCPYKTGLTIQFAKGGQLMEDADTPELSQISMTQIIVQ